MAAAAVMVASLVKWPPGPGWSLARWSGAAVAIVPAVAVSYPRAVLLLVGYGEPTAAAYLGPVALMVFWVMSAMAFAATRSSGQARQHRRPEDSGARSGGGD
ncbi:hypothetical protein [Cryptosporangium sp. NPDC048952]|uniref:hypothetical protein n=1 Tax=Cryptosporangium sp. NPDC048952 TaxID=3363961 RepID=UPI003711C9FE